MADLISALNGIGDKHITLSVNSPLYGTIFSDSDKQERLVKEIAAILENEVSIYKDIVFPTINSAITAIDVSIDRAVKLQSYYPRILPFEIPVFIADKLDSDVNTDSYREREISLILPNRIELDDIIAELDSEDPLQKEIKDYLFTKKAEDIEQAYELYILPTTFSVESVFMKDKNFEHLFIAYALSVLFTRYTLEGSRGNLDDYRYYMEIMNIYLLKASVNLARKYRNLENDDNVILDTGKDFLNDRIKTITVSSKNLSKYYANGGVIEAIYGAAITEPNYVPIYQLLENGDKYINAWDVKRIKYDTELKTRKIEIAKNVYKDLLPDLLHDLSEYVVAPIRGTLLTYMEGKTVGELLNIQTFVESFILDVLLKNTNASYFVKQMNYYLSNNNGDKKMAATSATTDLIISYLFNGVDVS